MHVRAIMTGAITGAKNPGCDSCPQDPGRNANAEVAGDVGGVYVDTPSCFDEPCYIDDPYCVDIPFYIDTPSCFDVEGRFTSNPTVDHPPYRRSTTLPSTSYPAIDTPSLPSTS